MREIDPDAHDLAATPLHLGLGGSARAVPDFSWERIEEYEAATAADGPDGRMVMSFRAVGAWTNWERHPVGDAVVIATSGTHRFIQELPDGSTRSCCVPARRSSTPPACGTPPAATATAGGS